MVPDEFSSLARESLHEYTAYILLVHLGEKRGGLTLIKHSFIYSREGTTPEARIHEA